jgi:hypothetical protein
MIRAAAAAGSIAAVPTVASQATAPAYAATASSAGTLVIDTFDEFANESTGAHGNYLGAQRRLNRNLNPSIESGAGSLVYNAGTGLVQLSYGVLGDPFAPPLDLSNCTTLCITGPTDRVDIAIFDSAGAADNQTSIGGCVDLSNYTGVDLSAVAGIQFFMFGSGVATQVTAS